MSDQLDNFRKMLCLDEDTPRQEVKEEIKKQVGVVQTGRTTITISSDMLSRLKLLSFWMNRQGVKKNPSMPGLLDELLNAYLEKNPEASEFVNSVMQ